MWFRKSLLSLGLAAAWPVVLAAQLTPTYTFTAGTVISPDQVNANFNLLLHALDRREGIVTTSITIPNTGLHLLDTDASHDLILAPGSNLTADRTLTVTTGDAARTVTLSGNPTLSDWFDQSVKAAASPTFAALTLTGGLTAGSGAVPILNAAGKIPAISSTYFANLDGGAITGIESLTTVSAKVADYTAVTTDKALTADGTFTITLYAASGNNGRVLEIKNIGTGIITIDGNGAELIDGQATLTLDGQYFSYTLVCDGTGWYIL